MRKKIKQVALLPFFCGLVAFMVLVTSHTSCQNSGGIVYQGFGANETVSGSLHKLTVDNKDYIIDVGIFYEKDAKNAPLPKDINVKNIFAVFITHAHADHMGRLPLLIESGYKGPIYMTQVTKDILLINIKRSIGFSDFGIESFYYSKNSKKKNDLEGKNTAVFMDRYNYGRFTVKRENRVYVKCRRSELKDKGLYLSSSTVEKLSNEIMQKLENQIIVVKYEQEIHVGNISAKFFYTSHLPGSSMVYITAKGKHILFTGDIGGDNNPLLKKNKKFPLPVDYLFVEGTYGVSHREQNSLKLRDELIVKISQALKDGKRIIIPAFAVDRSQQVLYEISRGIKNGIIPSNTNVYLYSPTAVEITKLYQKYSKNKSLYSKEGFSDKMFTDIFDIPNLSFPNISKDGINAPYSSITIATSGMMSSAFSRNLLKRYCSDPKTLFISVNYQDPSEAGGMLFSGQRQLHLDGEVFDVNAEIYRSNAFSGHASFEQIQNIFSEISPKKILLVHLNKKDEIALQNAYQSRYPKSTVVIPVLKRKYIL